MIRTHGPDRPCGREGDRASRSSGRVVPRGTPDYVSRSHRGAQSVRFPQLVIVMTRIRGRASVPSSDRAAVPCQQKLDSPRASTTAESFTRRDPSTSTPGRTRTCDRRFRKPLLYPPELRAQQTGTARAVDDRPNGIRLPPRAAPGRIRTCDLRFRKPPLYPPELRARSLPCLDLRASKGSCQLA